MTRRGAFDQAFPWGARSGLQWVALTGASGLGLIATSLLVDDRSSLAGQVGPLGMSIAMLIVGFVAQASLFITGRRAVGVRRYQLLSAALGHVEVAVAVESEVPILHADEGLLEWLGLVHRPSCAMTLGRSATRVTRTQADRRQLEACGLCAPLSAEQRDDEPKVPSR